MNRLHADILADAQALVAEAGMDGFVPLGPAPAATGGELFPIGLIDSSRRDANLPNFDMPDPERPGVVRSASILRAMRDATPLPPVVLYPPDASGGARLRAGFHRFHLAAALGFTHVRAVLDGWDFEVP